MLRFSLSETNNNGAAVVGWVRRWQGDGRVGGGSAGESLQARSTINPAEIRKRSATETTVLYISNPF